MAKKYFTNESLSTFIDEIKAGDAESLDSAKSYTDDEIAKITNGTTVIPEAEHATSADTAGSVAWDNVTNKPSTYTPSEHNHDSAYDTKGSADTALASAQSYTDGKISALLDGADDTTLDSIKELADAIKTNDSAIDALNNIAAGKANATHSHAIADVNGLQSALDGKAAQTDLDALEEAIAEFEESSSNKDAVVLSEAQKYTDGEIDKVELTISTLQGVVNGKANASHSHAISDITNLQSTLDGKANSSHSHSDATTSAAGFMTAAMVTKLNGIATEANKTIVDNSLSTSSTNPVQNKVITTAINSATSAISANTNSISAHTTAITNLQAAVDEFEEITSAEIQGLFKGSSNGYTVTITNEDSYMYGDKGYYSLDNGVTWNNFYDEEWVNVDEYYQPVIILKNVTQIKFKVDDRAYNNGIYVNIDCEQLNLALEETGPLESENFTLTSDIVVSYYDYDY